MSETRAPDPRADLRRWLESPPLLALVVGVVYAGSVSGGWLGYDDDWLARDNVLLNSPDPGVAVRIWLDLGRDTRLALGAEYLPIRDLLTWALRAWLGLDAMGLRLLCLALYAGACAGLLAWARAMPGLGYPIGVWLFALHPVHAESVAWIAGLKDVLALLFLGLAMWSYAQPALEHRHRLAILAWVMLACLSKAMAVIAPGLLLVTDLALGRRPDRTVLASTTVIALGLAALHAWVGGLVGMYAEPLGATPLERLGSVAVVMARYVALSLCAHPQSLAYDVDVHGLDAASLGACALLLALGASAGLALRRDVRWPAVALALFVIGLFPVLQLVASLQNRMADRYLLVAVLGPTLVVGHGIAAACGRLPPTLGSPIAAASFALLGVLSLVRALTLADPVTAFVEGTERTERDARMPVLLGDALVAEERNDEAEVAYRIAIERDGLRTTRGRTAANELGRILAGAGRLEEARALFATVVERYPDYPRALHNLALVEEGMGDLDAARAHREELAQRFPGFRPGTDGPGPL